MPHPVANSVVILVAFFTLTGCEASGGGATATQSVELPGPTAAVGDQDGASVDVVEEQTERVVKQTASSIVVRLGSLSFWVPDPAAERARYSDAYLAELYEGLTRFGPEGVELGLASGFTVDSAGTEYEFTLRPGLKFSNGEPVTAGDFKWSWARALSPRYSGGRGRAVLGMIVGAASVMGRGDDELSGVTVVDDRTLRVELVSALPSFPELLAEPAATVLHRPNVEKWGFDWSSWQGTEPSPRPPWYFDELPVGTGPFALTEFDFRDLTAVLSRNEHYWDQPAGLDKIELVGLDYEVVTLNPDGLLAERAVDTVFGIGGSLSPSEVDVVSGPVPVRFSVPSELELLVLDPRADGVADIGFRRALAASVTPPSSTGIRVWTDIGPFGSVGWTEAAGVVPIEVGHDWQEGTQLRGRLEAALAEYALDRADVSQSSEPITLEYFDATHGPDETLAQRIGSWESELGVELMPVYTTDSSAWFPPAGRTIAVRRVRIAPPTGSAYGYFSEIDLVFGADNDAPEVARFRELLARAVSEADDVERSRLYGEVERHLIEAALVIPLYVSDDYARSLVQPWLRGLETLSGLGSRFKGVWVDVEHADYFALE